MHAVVGSTARPQAALPHCLTEMVARLAWEHVHWLHSSLAAGMAARPLARALQPHGMALRDSATAALHRCPAR